METDAPAARCKAAVTSRGGLAYLSSKAVLLDLACAGLGDRPQPRGDMTMTRWSLPLLLAAAFLVATPLLATAQGSQVGHEGLEQVLAESAETPAQHRALANHSRAKAEAAKASAANHRSMAKHYGGTLKATVADKQKQHCQRLAEQGDEQARLYEDLAKAHDEAASPPQ
mgnify:CR=1 FL=1